MILTLALNIATLDLNEAFDLLSQSLVLNNELFQESVELFQAVFILLLPVGHGFEHQVVHSEAIVQLFRNVLWRYLRKLAKL